MSAENTCPALSEAVPLAEKAGRAGRIFAGRFGSDPAWIVAAPGRVNLIGEHVDYCEGLVLPMAIDRHVILAGGPRHTREARVFSEQVGQWASVALDSPPERAQPGWSNYLRGVLRGFMDRGFILPGLNLLIDSDLPTGGGLSSSAALQVATATLLEVALGTTLPPVEKALLCVQAEHDFAQLPCGIMDQFTSVFGRQGSLLLIDCRARSVQPVKLRDESVAILVINSGVRHELGGSQYPLRRAQCEEAARRLGLPALRDATMEQVLAAAPTWPEELTRRARHVVSEIARTRQAARALQDGKWDEAGRLMDASHASLRDDFHVSCQEVDLIVKFAGQLGRAEGVYGCRMTGGGFGGCCVALIEAVRAPRIAASLGEEYAAATGLRPTLFLSRPAAGAGRCPAP